MWWGGSNHTRMAADQDLLGVGERLGNIEDRAGRAGDVESEGLGSCSNFP